MDHESQISKTVNIIVTRCYFDGSRVRNFQNYKYHGIPLLFAIGNKTVHTIEQFSIAYIYQS